MSSKIPQDYIGQEIEVSDNGEVYYKAVYVGLYSNRVCLNFYLVKWGPGDNHYRAFAYARVIHKTPLKTGEKVKVLESLDCSSVAFDTK